MNKVPFQLTLEHVITHCIRTDHEGLWVWQEDNGTLRGFTETREEAERMIGVNINLRPEQLVELLYIIRAHKASLEPNAHIPEIQSWCKRVEDIQDSVYKQLLSSKDELD